MTRAVIRLREDISSLIPLMERRIAGFARNPMEPEGSFRYKNWPVVVESRQVTVVAVMNEAPAKEVIAFLETVLRSGDRTDDKVNPYQV